MNARAVFLFQRLRSRLLRNSLGTFLQGSRMRVLSIALVSLLIWSCVFAVSGWGFYFLRHEEQIPFAGSIVGTLFDFLFLSLALMLVFSCGIILYSSLFASPEINFLLTTPVPADQLFAYKFQGAVAFSSWAFLLLGTPVLLAYGLVYAVPWYFYALLPLFFIGFVLVPGTVGALLCLAIVFLVPRKRKHLLIAFGVCALAVLAVWGYRLQYTLENDYISRDLVQQMYGQIAFARGALMPSHWMTRGLQAAARGDLGEAGYRLALIWSNGLFLYLVTAGLAGRLYRRCFDRMASGGSMRRRYGGAWADRLLSGLVGFLHPQIRHLIVKDFRTFRRDPAQWAQIAIFTILLSFYFFNTRRFATEDLLRPYQNVLSLLNLVAVTLLMCAYTGRFIYPLLSLEGRKFWILGLLPMSRERLLWGKFAFSTVGTVFIAEFLMLASNWAIAMPDQVVVLHGFAVLVLAVGLSGLSVGLGAWMPNFRESDPSKIAVGFGGTLNLVASLLLVLLVIGLMVVPWHVRAALLRAELDVVEVDKLMSAGILAGVVLGVLAAVIPLRLGIRNLERLEF